MKNSGRTQARKCVRSLASLFLLLLAGAAFGAGYSATAQTLRLTATPNVIKPTSGKAASSITLSVQPDKEEQCDQKPAIDLTNDTLMIAGNAGITLSSQPTTKGKCLIAYTATIDPNVYPGNYKLILLDLNKNNLGFAEITIVDPAAGPLPPGLRPEVDVLWEVMSQKSCSDVFGSRVAERNYCIQLKVGNNSGYALQVAGIGFSTQLDALKDPRNDTGTVTIANSSYASTRAVLLTENVTSGRNIAYNILQATGVLMSAFTPYFGTGKHPNGTINNARTNWSTAASIVSGPLLSAFNIIAPNPVITQLNNLDDQSFRDNRVISNNTQLQTVVFVEKQSLTYQLATLGTRYPKLATDLGGDDAKAAAYKALTSTVDNSKNTRRMISPSRGRFNPFLVKLALGSVVIVGQHIEFLERVQVVNIAAPPPTSAAIINGPLNPQAGVPGDTVTITGASFGLSQGSSSVKFGSTAATDISSWSDTTIKVKVPTIPPGQKNVVVSAGGGDSAPATFTVRPSITVPLLKPAGAYGDTLTLNGNFGAVQGTVKFGSTIANVTSWSAISITVTVPGVAPGSTNIVVSGEGGDSAPATFTSAPSITAPLAPTTGVAGAPVTISGNFGAIQGTVKFGSTGANVTSWSAMSITVTVPNLSPGPKNVVVSAGGADSAPASFTVAPSITPPLVPTTGAAGASVTISGNFGTSQGTVKFGSTGANVTSWSATSITVTVPSLAPGPKNVVVSAGGTDSAPAPFTLAPSITSPLVPTTGAAGAPVTVSGNFGTSQGTVKFGSTAASVTSWSATSIVVTVPKVAAGTQNVVVSAGGAESAPATFTVSSPAH